MALEQRMEVEKYPHEGSSGSRARPVSKEVIPEGRRDVGGGRSDLRTIRQGGRRVEGPPKPVLCQRERHGQRIGPLRQLCVSSLGGDDRVNDACSRQHRLETLRVAGPQAGALDDLAQPTAARVHCLHRCLWLLVTWSWIGVSSVPQRLGSRWIGVVWRLYYMRVQTLLHLHHAGSILLLQLIPSACN